MKRHYGDSLKSLSTPKPNENTSEKFQSHDQGHFLNDKNLTWSDTVYCLRSAKSFKYSARKQKLEASIDRNCESLPVKSLTEKTQLNYNPTFSRLATNLVRSKTFRYPITSPNPWSKLRSRIAIAPKNNLDSIFKDNRGPMGHKIPSKTDENGRLVHAESKTSNLSHVTNIKDENGAVDTQMNLTEVMIECEVAEAANQEANEAEQQAGGNKDDNDDDAGAIIAGYKANAQASDEIQNAGGGDEEDGECMDLSRGGAENQPENTDNKAADNNNNDDEEPSERGSPKNNRVTVNFNGACYSFDVSDVEETDSQEWNNSDEGGQGSISGTDSQYSFISEFDRE